MSSFLRSKTWYIIPTWNRDMVSLSSSYDEEKRIFNQYHYGTAYEMDLLRRDLHETNYTGRYADMHSLWDMRVVY